MSKYKRVLLKITGEALKGNEPNFCPEAILSLAKTIQQAKIKYGVQLALVIGGGNLWRGGIKSTQNAMDRVTADYMGMLATVMNALALKDALLGLGVKTIVQTSIPMKPLAEPFDRMGAIDALEKGEIVIFAAGTGSPFFTTDTTAVLRALETNCDAVLKATKVDGIYSADPFKNPGAQRYETLSYETVIAQQLAVMDLTAFSLSQNAHLPIIVFNFSKAENLNKVLDGDLSVATLVQ